MVDGLGIAACAVVRPGDFVEREIVVPVIGVFEDSTVRRDGQVERTLAPEVVEVVLAHAEPGLADEARLWRDRLAGPVRVGERAVYLRTEGSTVQGQSGVLGLRGKRLVWRGRTPIGIVPVLVRAHEREPRGDRLFGPPHLVEGVPDQIVDPVGAFVGREPPREGLVESDRRCEVGRRGEVVLGREVAGLPGGLRIVVEILKVDGASFEVEFAQTKHRVRSVLGVVGVPADEVFENSNRIFTSLVEGALFSFEPLAIPPVALAPLLEILAPHQ